jgi:guanidinopropionase
MSTSDSPSKPNMSAPRFTQIPSFLRAPISRDYKNLDIGLVGIPFDGALSNRAGARHGPREVRNASTMMRTTHHVTNVNPHENARVADVGDVDFNYLFDIQKTHDEIEAFIKEMHIEGVMPLSVGGDHSVSLPILRVLGADRPVALIHIDAHTDTWDEFQGSKFNHGSPFRRAVEEGLIDPKKTIQIGIRGAQNTPEGWEYSQQAGMRVVFIEELNRIGIDAVIKMARDLIGDTPMYFTFDVDALDPVYAPGTGTPEIGGLTTTDALDLIRGFRGMNYVGGDVVEVSPPYDVAQLTTMAAATIMYEILCNMSESVA